MKRLCCLALALGLPLGALGAQEKPPLAVGARVRVITPKPDRTYPEVAPCYGAAVGALESMDSATIVVRRENGENVNVCRAFGTRVDVSTGRGWCSENRGECVTLGLYGGLALGALAGRIAVQSLGVGSGTSCQETCQLVYWLTVPAGIVAGAIVGGGVGGEHWQRAELPARLSVGRDGSGRFAVGLSLRFCAAVGAAPRVPPTAPDLTPGGISRTLLTGTRGCRMIPGPKNGGITRGPPSARSRRGAVCWSLARLVLRLRVHHPFPDATGLEHRHSAPRPGELAPSPLAH